MRNYADAVEALGVARARVAQILDLLAMPVDQQEAALTSVIR